MKKIYSILSFCLLTVFNVSAQTVIPTNDELVMPRFAYQGFNGASRVHVLCRLKLTGLTPSTQYRYFTGLSVVGNATAQVTGQFYQIRNTPAPTGGYINGFTVTKAINSSELQNNIYNTTNTSYHARFSTDANGEYTGWFSVVCGPNATHTPLNGDAYFYVQTNGGTGTALTQSFRTTSTIKLIGLDVASDSATAIIGTSNVGNEKIVALYDNVNFSGRPITTSFTENDSINQTLLTNWYTAVNEIPGSWGAIIPNNLPTGIRGIKFFEVDGSEIVLSNSPAANISNDGVWNGVSTVNPSGGGTAITINSIAGSSALPIQLTSFNAVGKKDGVQLNWTTVKETNNKFFELFRSNDNRNYQSIAKLNGALNAESIRTYHFFDAKPFIGNNFYQLKQIDVDGKTTTFNTVSARFNGGKNSLSIIAINENYIKISLQVTENQRGTISYIETDGRVLYKKSVNINAGNNDLTIPISKAISKTAIITYESQNERITLKTSRL